jgi:hypothetical protein
VSLVPLRLIKLVFQLGRCTLALLEALAMPPSLRLRNFLTFRLKRQTRMALP